MYVYLNQAEDNLFVSLYEKSKLLNAKRRVILIFKFSMSLLSPSHRQNTACYYGDKMLPYNPILTFYNNFILFLHFYWLVSKQIDVFRLIYTSNGWNNCEFIGRDVGGIRYAAYPALAYRPEGPATRALRGPVPPMETNLPLRGPSTTVSLISWISRCESLMESFAGLYQTNQCHLECFITGDFNGALKFSTVHYFLN